MFLFDASTRNQRLQQLRPSAGCPPPRRGRSVNMNHEFSAEGPITNKTAAASNVLPASRCCQDRAPWRTGAAKERKSEKRVSDGALAEGFPAANESGRIAHVRGCFAVDRSRKAFSSLSSPAESKLGFGLCAAWQRKV
ncbi:hypothetical protein VTN77DRAFT_5549 [Rasamsonia byssochlamydoides]|uniref:uncharacterized protein n=1 Tax=Rasamsonia byssochlamydoides TaxID=89139 RepID=UPI0037438F87